MTGPRHNSQARRWLARLAGVALGILVMSSQGAQAAGVGAATTGRVFGGFTSQRLPSFFPLTKNGEKLELGSIALRLKCTSGVKLMTEDDFSGLPITANGRLKGWWAFPPTKTSDGTIVGGADSFIGASTAAGRS